jgi:hypothetical protein
MTQHRSFLPEPWAVSETELVTNEPLPAAVQADPRASSGMGLALHSESFSKAPAQPPGRAPVQRRPT